MINLSLLRQSGVVTAFLLIGGMISCKGPGPKTTGADSATHRGDFITLPDGTKAFHTERTKLRAVKGDHPADRTYELDGEAWFIIRDADKKPFILRTRQLIITIQSPFARLHIDAFASSPGEQADLLEGQLKVTKSYHSSTDNEPETLRSGDMVMINKEIDLMEKETLDSVERKAVEKKFPKLVDTIPHN